MTPAKSSVFFFFKPSPAFFFVFFWVLLGFLGFIGFFLGFLFKFKFKNDTVKSGRLKLFQCNLISFFVESGLIKLYGLKFPVLTVSSF